MTTPPASSSSQRADIPEAPAPGQAPGEAPGEGPGEGPGEARAQPPIRWPHPDRFSLALAGLWLVGLIVALFVPAMFVPPNAQDPEPAAVWTAFSFTGVGAALMLVAAGLMWRRSRDPMVLVFGGVPAFACVAGGVVLTATKLFESFGPGA